MKISVALCTYNGSRFLDEQLESISGQSRVPDELVVCDDFSTDDSVSIASGYAAKAPFPVHIHRNERTLGSTKNFEQAIAKCTGDVIVLSDQDDRWHSDKVSVIEAEFQKFPKTGLVFSDAVLVDEALHPIGLNLWRTTFRPYDQDLFRRGRAMGVLFQYNVVTGATMAFRASLRPGVLPIPILTEFIHDGWISLIASMCSDVRFITKPLIDYRQHTSQQIGAKLDFVTGHNLLPRNVRYMRSAHSLAPSLRRLEEFANEFSEQRLESIRLVALRPELVPAREHLQALIRNMREKIIDNENHLLIRSSLPKARIRRLGRILAECRTGRYWIYSRGWQSALLDLIRK